MKQPTKAVYVSTISVFACRSQRAKTANFREELDNMSEFKWPKCRENNKSDVCAEVNKVRLIIFPAVAQELVILRNTLTRKNNKCFVIVSQAHGCPLF